jgi:NADH-quinone oxidoreductase subunit N
MKRRSLQEKCRVSIETVLYLLPELWLIVAASLIYVGGAFLSLRSGWNWIGALVLLAAMLLLAEPRTPDAIGPVGSDLLATYLRWLALVVGIPLLAMTTGFNRRQGSAERVGSILLIVAGVMLAASAREIVMLFASLELVSIPTYVLLTLGRRDPTDQEVATKYFLLSILSSSLILYGFSFLYGVGGSLELSQIALRLRSELSEPTGLTSLAALALVLVFAGLAFRLAAVPFHFYAPDVYQGTTNPIAALLSVIPKMAGLIVLMRVVGLAMPGMETFAWRLALVLAAATMTLGNLLALWQDNVRRLLAYSSIAHAGYLLVGAAVWFAVASGGETAAGFDGFGAALFYLTVYSVATLGAFAALAYVGHADDEVDHVERLDGLGRTSPLAGAALAICLFSLAGMPPLAGFWGKFTLFAGAVAIRSGAEGQPLEPWFIGLAILGMLNAAVAAAYYLRLVAAMYFKSPGDGIVGRGGTGPWATMIVCALAVLWLGVSPGPVLQSANDASPAPHLVVMDSVAQSEATDPEGTVSDRPLPQVAVSP